MTKEFHKAIYNRIRLRRKFCKIPSEENQKLYKKQKSKCVAIREKSIRNYFNKVTNGNIATNRNFWKMIKLFLSNKGHLENVDIMLNHDGSTIIKRLVTEEYSFDNDKQATEIICNS